MKKLSLLFAMLIAGAGLSAHITGNLTWGKWNGSMTLTALSAADNPDEPIILFELGNSDRGDNYMSHVRGYFIPQVTGECVFWVCSAYRTSYGATATPARGAAIDYTVSVTQLPLQTGNLVTRFYLDPLGQEAIIDDDAFQVIPGSFFYLHYCYLFEYEL